MWVRWHCILSVLHQIKIMYIIPFWRFSLFCYEPVQHDYFCCTIVRHSTKHARWVSICLNLCTAYTYTEVCISKCLCFLNTDLAISLEKSLRLRPPDLLRTVMIVIQFYHNPQTPTNASYLTSLKVGFYFNIKRIFTSQ